MANEIIAYSLAHEMADQQTARNVVMLLTVVGCWLAGMVGIFKAFTMRSGLEVLLCLLGATMAFGTALCVYFQRK